MAASCRNDPTETTGGRRPRRAVNAVSDVPPPTSTMLAAGSLPAGRPQCGDHRLLDDGHRQHRRAASVTARRSSLIADGTQMTTRGRLNFDAGALGSSRIMRWVTSGGDRSWRGRTARVAGGWPIIAEASDPWRTSPVCWFSGSDGSLTRCPALGVQGVIVPRSMADRGPSAVAGGVVRDLSRTDDGAAQRRRTIRSALGPAGPGVGDASRAEARRARLHR